MHSISGRNNRDPTNFDKTQKIVITRDNQISTTADGRRDDLVVVRIPADRSCEVSRQHAFDQGRIAIEEIRCRTASLQDRLQELRSAEHTCQLRKQWHGTDQLNLARDARVNQPSREASPDQP